MQNFQMALKMAGAELIVFLAAIISMFFLSSLGIYAFENPVQPEVFTSVFSSLWWAVITLTTVGYGDMVPITVGGKILSSVILLLGVGLVAVPTGIITSALTKAKEENLKKKKK